MNFRQHVRSHARRSSGQTYLFIVVFVAIFLAGVIGLATDYSQVWARRQMVQAAADASCQAGAADLYLHYVNPTAATAYGLDYSWIGAGGSTGYDCTTHSSSSPCQYAALNGGYSGSNVTVSFPSSVSGAPNINGFGVSTPYITVAVSQDVPLSFTRILSPTGTVNIHAQASCGLVTVSSPIPLLILHPSMDGSFNRNGGASFTIYGGPQRSIQVNSSSTSAVTPLSGGSGIIDLSHGGPNNTGSDMGVFGNQTDPGYVHYGTTGKWIAPALPWSDPFASIPEPSVPAATGAATLVGFGWNGCPDPAGCVEFTAGKYDGVCSSSGNFSATYNGYVGGQSGAGCLVVPTPFGFSIPAWGASTSYQAGQIVQPPNAVNAGKYAFQAQGGGTTASSAPAGGWNQTFGGTTTDGGILWKNIGAFANHPSPSTAIFDPGVYYIGSEGLQLGSGSTARQSTATGDGSKGTTFFFAENAGSGQNHGTINVRSNTGSQTGCVPPATSSCIASYKPDASTQTFGLFTVESAGMKCPGGDDLPSQVPATIDGNVLMGPCSGTYGGSSDGKNRGFLFFQKRTTSVAAVWSGGGSFVLSGFMYFHNTAAFSSSLEMGGNSGSTALTLGDIVTDQAQISGTPNLAMILNPNITYPILKPQLLQ